MFQSFARTTGYGSVVPDPSKMSRRGALEEKLQYAIFRNYAEVHRQLCFDPGKESRGANQTGGWVGPRATQ